MDSDDCRCDLSEYQPVCINDLSYYSTCYAGCNSANLSAIEQCSCVPPTVSLSVSQGRCSNKNECKPSVYLALYFFVLFFSFLNAVPVRVKNSSKRLSNQHFLIQNL